MKVLAITICLLLTATVTAHAQNVYGVHSDDQIIISTNGFRELGGAGPSVSMVGLDIASSEGSLVPFDPAIADPFTFFISNTNESIVMASGLPTSPVAVADDQIKIGYTGHGCDITASYGDEFSQHVIGVSSCLLPEPGSGGMAMVVAIGLLGLRRTR